MSSYNNDNQPVCPDPQFTMGQVSWLTDPGNPAACRMLKLFNTLQEANKQKQQANGITRVVERDMGVLGIRS